MRGAGGGWCVVFACCTDPGLHPRFYSPGGEAKPFSAPLFCGVNVAGADPRLIVQVCGPCWPGLRAFGSSSGHGPCAAALHSKLGQPLCGDEQLESTVVPTFKCGRGGRGVRRGVAGRCGRYETGSRRAADRGGSRCSVATGGFHFRLVIHPCPDIACCRQGMACLECACSQTTADLLPRRALTLSK